MSFDSNLINTCSDVAGMKTTELTLIKSITLYVSYDINEIKKAKFFKSLTDPTLEQTSSTLQFDLREQSDDGVILHSVSIHCELKTLANVKCSDLGEICRNVVIKNIGLNRGEKLEKCLHVDDTKYLHVENYHMAWLIKYEAPDQLIETPSITFKIHDEDDDEDDGNDNNKDECGNDNDVLTIKVFLGNDIYLDKLPISMVSEFAYLSYC